MSARTRKHEAAPPPVEASASSGEVRACPRCDQEMVSPDGNLPLHMGRDKTFCLGSGTAGAPPKFGQQIREPLTISDISQLSVSEILAADSCLSCGGPKTPGQPICKTCHGLLPFIHQQCLPDFVHGFLYSDEKKEVGGISKQQFMEVLKSALTELAAMRGGEQTGGEE